MSLFLQNPAAATVAVANSLEQPRKASGVKSVCTTRRAPEAISMSCGPDAHHVPEGTEDRALVTDSGPEPSSVPAPTAPLLQHTAEMRGFSPDAAMLRCSHSISPWPLAL